MNFLKFSALIAHFAFSESYQEKKNDKIKKGNSIAGAAVLQIKTPLALYTNCLRLPVLPLFEKLRVLRLQKMNRICLKTSKLNYNRDHSESIRLDLKEPKPETKSVLWTHPGDR